jgi:hypothetical protein
MSKDRLALNGSLPGKRKSPLDERNRQAEQALATRYDALNQAFVEAEQRLKALKPLHPVWVDYNHDYCEGQPDQWELLGLFKHQGKWRLCHATDHEMNDCGFDDIKPVVECPVDVRVRAAKIVRQLHEKIVKSKEEYIPQVDEAIRELTYLFIEI